MRKPTDLALPAQGVRELLSIKHILRFGALPLGLKTQARLFGGERKILNLGLLSMDRPEMLQRIEWLVKHRPGMDDLSAIEPSQVTIEDFLGILDEVYRITSFEIRARAKEDLDERLRNRVDGGGEKPPSAGEKPEPSAPALGRSSKSG